ncbi:MAG: murein L,D-transpeptidase family protein, partial [Bdellovibrionia bacterium]
YAKTPRWTLQAPPGVKANYLLADKKRRQLHLLRDGKVIRTYRMALGDTPQGDKKCQGDGKTPEGIYSIEYKNSASSFHLSLAVSYPNQEDINEARKLGCSPGGDIMVHGLPNERWKWSFLNHPADWTQGCMAVTNDEIEEMWSLVEAGTTIEICK